MKLGFATYDCSRIDFVYHHVYLCIYIYIYILKICKKTKEYIYIYIDREREEKRDTYEHIFLYMTIYTKLHI